MALDRRTFLKGGGAAAAGLALGGPFQGFVSRAAATFGPTIAQPVLVPTPDQRDQFLRLALPAGFSYRSFDANPIVPPGWGTTALPGNHDGMAAFNPGPRVVLIRNHEVNGSLGAYTTSAPTYDTAAPGGCTRVVVGLSGEESVTTPALAGTQMNCAGGRMPWGSWVTCEETVNGPDVFDDFTRNPPAPAPPLPEDTYVQNARLTKPHGYLFEVPVDGVASAKPIRSAGRFSHEACAFDPNTGSVYMTEDDFGFGSGFYRYDPPVNPRRAGRLEDGGSLWMLGVAGTPRANLSGAQVRGTRYPVTWIRIDHPDRSFPMASGKPTTTNNQAIHFVAEQGWEDGAAVFSRTEGCAYDKGIVYFTATQGGGALEPVDWTTSAELGGGFGNGTGQVWAYDPHRQVLEVVYQSSGPLDLNLPDNVTTSARGTLILCEDNSPPTGHFNTLQALTKWGQLIPIADHLERPRVEFAGATFSTNGRTLYVNLNTGVAMSVAIWGPWEQLGI